MIFSMTGFAAASRELWPASASAAPTSVQVEVRSVNSRFLDVHFKVPDDARAAEGAIREQLMAALGRGKVEVRVHIQRAEAGAGNTLQQTAVDQLVAMQANVLAAFPSARPLAVAEILRWPGVLGDVSIAADALREAIVDAAREAIQELVAARAREGEALRTMLIERVDAMEAIVARITPLVPELVERHRQKIVDRLREALGLVWATPAGEAGTLTRDEVEERIRQEVTVYGIRIDIAEELSRLTAHLGETRLVLAKGGKVGKRLDFMMQELNREANTVGAKAAAKELADASMALKLLIEQMREQVQNLE